MFIQNQVSNILSWIGEFRPGNKTIWVVFDVDTDFLGPRAYLLSLDLVYVGKHTLYKIREQSFIIHLNPFLGGTSPGMDRMGFDTSIEGPDRFEAPEYF